MEYQELNAEIINKWCQEGWEWVFYGAVLGISSILRQSR